MQYSFLCISEYCIYKVCYVTILWYDDFLLCTIILLEIIIPKHCYLYMVSPIVNRKMNFKTFLRSQGFGTEIIGITNYAKAVLVQPLNHYISSNGFTTIGNGQDFYVMFIFTNAYPDVSFFSFILLSFSFFYL